MKSSRTTTPSTHFPPPHLGTTHTVSDTWFSMTKWNDMTLLFEALDTFWPSQRETGMENWTIVDGTANAGAETLAWMYHLFVEKQLQHPRIISVECQPQTYLALCRNLSLYDQAWNHTRSPQESFLSHVTPVCENLLSFWTSISQTQVVDLLIVDPPWGGPQYKDQAQIENLYMMTADGCVELVDALLQMMSHQRPRFVLIKVPKQYHVSTRWEQIPLDELYVFQHMKFKWLVGRVAESSRPSGLISE